MGGLRVCCRGRTGRRSSGRSRSWASSRSPVSSRRTSILAAAMEHGTYGYILCIAGLAGTFLTGIYTFRLLFVVFGGEPSPFVREHVHAPARRRRCLDGRDGGRARRPLGGRRLDRGLGLWHPFENGSPDVAEPVVTLEPTWQEYGRERRSPSPLGRAGIGVAWLLYGRQVGCARARARAADARAQVLLRRAVRRDLLPAAVLARACARPMGRGAPRHRIGSTEVGARHP